MRSSGNADAQAALKAIDALEADHDRADADHAEVDALGRKWLAEHRLSSEETKRLKAVLLSLQALYQRHIAVEDTQVFPLAGKALDAAAAQAVVREMAERREIDLDTLPDLKLRCPTRRIPSHDINRAT